MSRMQQQKMTKPAKKQESMVHVVHRDKKDNQ